MIQISKLLNMEYKDEIERDEAYIPYLINEQKAWLMGVIAELAQDTENAKIFS